MMENQTGLESANWQITNGMTVYATDGTKVGTVRNYDPQANYLDVHKGWLFAKDFYVPFTAIDAVTEDGVVLRLAKEDLEGDRYSVPPAAGGVVYTESTSATIITADKEPVVEDREDTTVMHTADGRPIR